MRAWSDVDVEVLEYDLRRWGLVGEDGVGGVCVCVEGGWRVGGSFFEKEENGVRVCASLHASFLPPLPFFPPPVI